jgi:hypothetical protein
MGWLILTFYLQGWTTLSPLAGLPRAKSNLKEKQHRKDVPNDESWRSFLGRVGLGRATAAALAVGVSLEPLIAGKDGEAEASVVNYRSHRRVTVSL